jgi:hypothetical protein
MANVPSGSPASFNDWLQIGGAYLKQQTGTTTTASEMYVTATYYCGAGIGRDTTGTGNTQNQFNGNDDGTGVLLTTNGPFFITFNADKNPGLVPDPSTINNQQLEAKNELGFSLDYRISTSCSDLSMADSN